MLLTQTEMIYARGVKDLLCNPRYPIYNPAVMTGPKAMSFASPVENPAAACAATCTGYDFVGVQNVAMENGQVSVQCT